jgi:nitrite reductase/ring-hydroxylating ferredoxin subunit
MPEFKIARTDEVAPGQARSIRVEDRQVALFNLDGEFVAIDDACPEFDLDTGNCINVEWAKVRRYPVRLDGQEVHLTVEPDPEPEEQDDFPEIVWKGH